MLTIRHKISGVAPAVNDFKGKASPLLDAHLEIGASGHVNILLPSFDPNVVPKVLLSIQGDFVSDEAADEVNFQVTGLPFGSFFVWTCPNDGALVLPVKTLNGPTILTGFRVLNLSSEPGKAHLVVTT